MISFIVVQTAVELLTRGKYLGRLALGTRIVRDDGGAIGFLGVDGPAIEALFIEPGQLRRGGGRKLVEHARLLARQRALTPLTVDVNEQNPEAVRFYEACGFEVIGRSPVDAAGRPLPLLHLRESGGRG